MEAWRRRKTKGRVQCIDMTKCKSGRRRIDEISCRIEQRRKSKKNSFAFLLRVANKVPRRWIEPNCDVFKVSKEAFSPLPSRDKIEKVLLRARKSKIRHGKV